MAVVNTNATSSRLKRLPGKLSRPHFEKTVARARLFRLIDRARKRPIVWVSAPAGSGKTTLVASYLKARNLKHVWYQIDARDQDPATFFYYLREAIMHLAPRKRETLPLLTPEYIHGLPAFGRNFFELAFARLSRPAVFVIDNYQDIREDAPLHTLLSEGLGHVPEGITVVIASRTEPPAAFARLKMQRALTVINADPLALTLAEARDIARLRGVPALAPDALKALHARVCGWVAGWVLVVEGSLKEGVTSADFPPATREALFDYFAAELFNRSSASTQELLMQCALLPQMNAAMAEFVTNRPRTEALLARLVRHGYFTTRSSGANPFYQFHPLFRECLLERGRAWFERSQYLILIQRAASALIAAGLPDHAAKLLQECGDQTSLVDLILEHAPILAAQGRLATLEQWLHGVPEIVIASQPQLSYWLGTCRMPYDLREARAHFERAYLGFKQAGQPFWTYSAWARIVETIHYEWDDFTQLDRWINEINALMKEHLLEHHPDAEAHVVCAVLPILSFARPDTFDLVPWRDRAHRLLEGARDTSSQAPLLVSLLAHYVWSGNLDETKRLSQELQEFVTDPHAEPLVRLYGLRYLAISGWMLGKPEVTVKWATFGIDYGAQNGIRAHELALLSQMYHACQIDDDCDTAEKVLARARPLLAKAGRLHKAHHDFTAAWLNLRKGDLPAARRHAEKALAIAELLTAPFGMALGWVRLGEVLVEFGEYDLAHRYLDLAVEFGNRQGSPILQSMAGAFRAWTWLRQGKTELCFEALARALRQQRDHGIVAYANWNSRVMAVLCQFALERDLEPDFVRRLIRLRRLMPESPAWELEAWPFPIKIYTLGRFGVVRDDQPLVLGGNRRPFDLLKALVALGGRDVNEDRLMELLWPDAEGDAARHALKITVHRLRKLLPERSLVWAEGRLTLDSRLVWVDAWAFERLIGTLDSSMGDNKQEVTTVIALVRKALTFYRGAFLSEDAPPWALSTRERLRGKFLRVIDRAAEALRTKARYDGALDCYEKALDVDPLAERFYQGVMICQQSLGRHAEALVTYRRCREVLRRELNVVPSDKTEALYRRLRLTA